MENNNMNLNNLNNEGFENTNQSKNQEGYASSDFGRQTEVIEFHADSLDQSDMNTNIEANNISSQNTELNVQNESNSSIDVFNAQPRSFNQNNDGDDSSSKAASFYTESYSKPNRTRNVGISQMIIVAVVSSIIGGGVVGAFFQFGLPNVQPSNKGFFSSMIGSDDKTQKTDVSNGVKKVEIVKSSDSAVTTIAEKVSPSIVGIRVTFKSSRGFIFDMDQEQKSEGSGIISKADGNIITNYHVIEAALNNSGKQSSNAKIEVILASDKEKSYEAQIVGGDSKTDLAVLKIDAKDLPAAEFGNSDDLKVGDLAVAIGNPGGLEYMGSVTVGVISGLNRTIPVTDGKELKLLQTDAAINPGNSGGALVNSQGQVIGINTAKISAEGFEGLGFAIPINKVKEITSSLMEFKYVKGRPLLGIQADDRFTEEVAKEYDVPMGVLVSQVTPFTGAYKAGITSGDIITKFDGKSVKSVSDINEIKNKHKPNDIVNVEIYRDGETKTLKVQLTEDKGATK